MIRPMPSPRGTNHERLFILRGRGPRMAYDSKRGLARDDDYPRATEHFEGGVDTLAEWCAENLGRKDIERLIEALNSTLNKRTVETLTSDSRAKRSDERSSDPLIRAATDEVFRTLGMSDSRRRGAGGGDFTAMFPDLAPNRVLPLDLAESPSPRRGSREGRRKAAEEFSAMFPDLPPNRVL